MPTRGCRSKASAVTISPGWCWTFAQDLDSDAIPNPPTLEKLMGKTIQPESMYGPNKERWPEPIRRAAEDLATASGSSTSSTTMVSTSQVATGSENILPKPDCLSSSNDAANLQDSGMHLSQISTDSDVDLMALDLSSDRKNTESDEELVAFLNSQRTMISNDCVEMKQNRR